MATDKVLIHSPQIGNFQSSHGYPADAVVFPVGNKDYEIHLIWAAGAPGANYAKAPNGSYITDQTNAKVYQKSGALGAIDGVVTALN